MRHFFFSSLRIAALKNIGEKTSNLFERKKKEVGDLATEKATEAQSYAEEQAKKVGDSIEQTKKEAGEIIGGTGEQCHHLCFFYCRFPFEMNTDSNEIG